MKKILLIPFIFSLLMTTAWPKTPLQPGDVVITGLHSDGTDRFVWAPLVDLEPGQVLYFTDANWNAERRMFQRQINFVSNPLTDSPSGGAIAYTAPPTGLKAGTVVEVFINSRTRGEPGLYQFTVVGASAADFTGANDLDVVGDQGVSIATTGDKLFVLTGSLTAPVFLFGVNLGASRWYVASTTAQHSSDLPAELTDGVTAVAIGAGPTAGDEVDNGRYIGPTSGRREELLARIADTAYWEKSDEDIIDLRNGVAFFSLIPPPHITVSMDTVFVEPGDSARLAITVYSDAAFSLGAMRMRLVTRQPSLLRFPESSESHQNMLLAMERHPSGDTLTVGYTPVVPVPITPETPLRPGMITVFAEPGAIGREIAVDIADDTSFTARDHLGRFVNRSGRAGLVQIGKRGDINRDARISILDVIRLVNMIIEDRRPVHGSLDFSIADANGDRQIDITDIIRQVNIILGRSYTKALQNERYSSTSAFTGLGEPVYEDHGNSMVPLYFSTTGRVVGFEATLRFDPNEMTVGDVHTEGVSERCLESRKKDGMLYLIGIDFSGDGKGWDNAPAPMIPVNLIKDQGALDLVELRLFDQNGQALPVERFTPSQQLNRATFSTARFSLMASVPNPFNPSTTIRYEVAQTSHIRLSIYNLLGQEVTRLVDAVQATGRYSVVWDGRNSLGQTVASGIYTYRMTTDTGFTDVKRMTLVK